MDLRMSPRRLWLELALGVQWLLRSDVPNPAEIQQSAITSSDGKTRKPRGRPPKRRRQATATVSAASDGEPSKKGLGKPKRRGADVEEDREGGDEEEVTESAVLWSFEMLAPPFNPPSPMPGLWIMSARCFAELLAVLLSPQRQFSGPFR
jgi:hypothetical protein